MKQKQDMAKCGSARSLLHAAIKHPHSNGPLYLSLYFDSLGKWRRQKYAAKIIVIYQIIPKKSTGTTLTLAKTTSVKSAAIFWKME